MGRSHLRKILQPCYMHWMRDKELQVGVFSHGPLIFFRKSAMISIYTPTVLVLQDDNHARIKWINYVLERHSYLLAFPPNYFLRQKPRGNEIAEFT